jgi:hypothetical protein
MGNVGTKIAFKVGYQEGSELARQFGRLVNEQDFTGLPPHEAIALIGTDTGSVPPVTIKTKPLPKKTNTANYVREYSRQNYGRPIADVQNDLVNYGLPEQAKRPKRSKPQIGGGDEW